jgi:hypothetical protein
MRKIIGKNLKELREMAKEYNIKGRSKMNYESLQRELWKVVYGENYIPKNREESSEFLLLHPNHLVQNISDMWMTYGGKKIVEALETVSRCHATTLHEKSNQNPVFTMSQALGDQALEDMVKANVAAIYSNISCLSVVLQNIENQYYAEKYLEKWEGDVLYLVSEQGFLSENQAPFQLFFYQSGKTRPNNTSGWILLKSGQKELAKNLIKQRWEYDESSECYWVSISEVESLKEYLDVIEVSGGMND